MRPKQQRLQELILLLEQENKIHIKDAAARLGVSEITIRRYFHEQGEQFNIIGGYIFQNDNEKFSLPYNVDHAKKINLDEKKRACEYCLSLLEYKQTIFIDCGTTLIHLAQNLPDDLELTVVCYSLDIASVVASRSNVKLIVLGGVYHESAMTFSPLEHTNPMQHIAMNTAFITTSGFHNSIGATSRSFHEAQMKKMAIEQCETTVLVMDESKRDVVKPAKFAHTNDIDYLITEQGVTNFRDGE